MIRYPSILSLLAVLSLAALPRPAEAVDPVDVTVSGDELIADLEVPGGLSARLTVRFENVVGLSEESLNISASLVNPLDLGLLARLGDTVSSLSSGLPILISIEPDPRSVLTFSGTVDIEVYTHDLHFLPGSPLRLYSASHGGRFHDITVRHGAGSYRSGGTKGNFSEFMIVADLRTPHAAAGDKLQRLRDLLERYAARLDAGIYQELSGLVGAAEAAYASGSLVAAVTYVETFSDTVRNHGSAIPNVWSSCRNVGNISGRLRAAADTLRFSLTLALNDA